MYYSFTFTEKQKHFFNIYIASKLLSKTLSSRKMKINDLLICYTLNIFRIRKLKYIMSMFNQSTKTIWRVPNKLYPYMAQNQMMVNAVIFILIQCRTNMIRFYHQIYVPPFLANFRALSKVQNAFWDLFSIVFCFLSIERSHQQAWKCPRGIIKIQ